MINQTIQNWLGTDTSVEPSTVLKHIFEENKVDKSCFATEHDLLNYVKTMLLIMDPNVLMYGHNDALDAIAAAEDIDLTGRVEHPKYPLKQLFEIPDVWYLAYKLAPCCKMTPKGLLIETYFDDDVQRTAEIHHGIENVIPIFIGRVAKRLRGDSPIKLRRVTNFGKTIPYVRNALEEYFSKDDLENDTLIEAYSWVLQHNPSISEYEVAAEVHATCKWMEAEITHLLDDDYCSIGLADILSDERSSTRSPYYWRNLYFNSKDKHISIENLW